MIRPLSTLFIFLPMRFQSSQKHSLLDLIVLLAVVTGITYIAYRLTYSLEYKWNWSIIPTYLFRYNQETGQWQMNMLMQGLMTTIKLSIWGTLFAALIGFWMGFMRTSARLFNRLVGTTYVEIIRNIPPLVLIFIFYFFISDQIMPIIGVEDFLRSQPEGRQNFLVQLFTEPNLINAFLTGVITIGIFQGAYITEIVRGGIESIGNGQWEASSALGLSRFQQMRLVILPQAFRIMLPPLANEFINTIKYSALVSVISIQELTFQGLQVIASTQVNYEIWITITVMYLILCLILSMAVNWLEKKTAI